MEKYSGTLILTSDGLTTPTIIEEVKKASGEIAKKKVAIVTTASKDKEHNPYSKKARDQYYEMGFDDVTFVDLEAEPNFDFTPYHLFHVTGGNTFKLLYFARLSNFKAAVEKLLERGGVYVGVSAGTIILGPSIQFVHDNKFDPNLMHMTDFAGFNIIPETIFVHYSSDYTQLADMYEKENAITFTRITDQQAVLVTKDKTEII